MRTILAMGVALLCLAGCPNYGAIQWTDPTPTAPTADMATPSTPGPDMTTAPTPPDMAQAPADLDPAPTADMATAPDLAQAPDLGCVPPPTDPCYEPDVNDPNGKTVICHIPPGNPANRHTLIVGDPAVAAHLAHGDYLGECKAVCQ